MFAWLDLATTIGEGEEWEERVDAMMYADDLTMVAEDAEGLEAMLDVLGQWCREWRMDLSSGLGKKAKSEVVVFGEKGIERRKGWKVGEGGEVIKEAEWTRLLGVEIDEMMKMERYRKGMAQKTGGLMLGLREVGKVMGEEAAMKAWRSFMQTRLVYGCEVFVWWTKKIRGDMDKVQREVWRKVLGLDRGTNNALLYGEVEEMKLSTKAELMVERYEKRVLEGSGELVKKIWRVRNENGKDRWMRERRRTETSTGRLADQALLEAVGERDEREWRAELDRSRERLVVYRKTVESRGDGERWCKMEYGLRRWWRAFRGGLLHGGKRRKYGWRQEMMCEWCGEERGGVGHWVLRCSAIEVERQKLLRMCGRIVGGWGGLTMEGRIEKTMGGRGGHWNDEESERMWKKAAILWRKVQNKEEVDERMTEDDPPHLYRCDGEISDETVVEAECGHLFCGACIQRYTRPLKKPDCPKCGKVWSCQKPSVVQDTGPSGQVTGGEQ